MQPLEAAIADAAALGRGELAHDAATAEVDRIMQICNACRYCEGYCAVFPAMTRRLAFPAADVHYLANLCHHCGSCYSACQYAPPHDFRVNVPRALAKVRARTYRQFAWPAPLGGLYDRAGLTVALALAGGLALFLLAVLAWRGSLTHAPLAGNFYAIFPHNLLAGLFGAVFLWDVLALGMGVTRFWRMVRPAERLPAPAPALTEAVRDVLRLKYLDGGHGEGCSDRDEGFSLTRRWLHQCTMHGFLLCFAATVVATFYHYVLGLPAPYALTSLPVVLGTLGGIGLLIGPVGLALHKRRRNPEQQDASQNAMDYGFMALLALTSATGLALLAGRDGPWMAALLAVHLGVVLALFLTLPYGKFAHGVFRGAALLKHAIEKRLPNRLALGSD